MQALSIMGQNLISVQGGAGGGCPAVVAKMIRATKLADKLKSFLLHRRHQLSQRGGRISGFRGEPKWRRRRRFGGGSGGPPPENFEN